MSRRWQDNSLSTPVAGDDFLYRDVNDTTDDADGTVKRASVPNVCKAYLNSAANTTQLNNWGKVPLDTAEFDTGSWWDAANDRIVPDRPGYYLVIGRARTSVGDALRQLSIYKNGTIGDNIGTQDRGTNLQAVGGSTVVYCDGVDDYLELYAYELGSGTSYSNSAGLTYLTVYGPVAF